MASTKRYLRCHPQSARVARNISWLWFNKAFYIFFGAFVSIFVARYLGPNQFGALDFCLATIVLFGIFTNLGLENVVVKYLVKEPDNHDVILGTTFSLQLTGGIFVIAGVNIFALLGRDSSAPVSAMIAIMSVSYLFKPFETINYWFQHKIKCKYTALPAVFASALSGVLKLTLIYLRAPVVLFAAMSLVEVFLTAAGLIVAYQLDGRSIVSWRASKHCARVLLSECWPLLLTGINVMLLKKIDQVMLGTMDSKYAVGIYSASVRLSDCWSFLPVAVVTSIFPLLVGLRQTDKLHYSQAVQKLHDALVWLAIGVALLVTFFGTDIVHFIFGSNYDDSVRVLSIHIWSAVFGFTGIIRGKWLIIEGLTKYSFITTLLGSICNIGLNVFLIPLYGPVGAAVATLISRVFMSYILSCFLRPMWPCFVFFNKAVLAPVRYIVKWLRQRQ